MDFLNLLFQFEDNYGQGPVVLSIVSLTSSLVVKMLTVLVSTISNSQCHKCESYSHVFSKNINV